MALGESLFTFATPYDETFQASLCLDTDEDPDTGAPEDVVGGNLLVRGTEFGVSVGSGPSRAVSVFRYVGAPSYWQFGASLPGADQTTDGVTFAVPLSKLGNDDGRVNFRIASAKGNVADVMPDLGLPPGNLH